MLYGGHINIPAVVWEFWVLTNGGAAQALYVGASETVTNGPLPSDYKGQSIVLVPATASYRQVHTAAIRLIHGLIKLLKTSWGNCGIAQVGTDARRTAHLFSALVRDQCQRSGCVSVCLCGRLV